ncbi:MAG: hypothetical protein U1E10_16955, partial [Bdellovibrionales bacterium]|nr:hypothetical protein [Bdellovibrionales bacterium]
MKRFSAPTGVSFKQNPSQTMIYSRILGCTFETTLPTCRPSTYLRGPGDATENGTRRLNRNRIAAFFLGVRFVDNRFMFSMHLASEWVQR